MQLLQADTFVYVVPHNIVGYIVACLNVVFAFGDSSLQSHVLHQLHVCLRACWHPE